MRDWYVIAGTDSGGRIWYLTGKQEEGDLRWQHLLPQYDAKGLCFGMEGPAAEFISQKEMRSRITKQVGCPNNYTILHVWSV